MQYANILRVNIEQGKWIPNTPLPKARKNLQNKVFPKKIVLQVTFMIAQNILVNNSTCLKYEKNTNKISILKI